MAKQMLQTLFVLALLSLEASGQEKIMVCKDIQNVFTDTGKPTSTQMGHVRGPPGKRGVQGSKGPPGLPGTPGLPGAPGGAVDYDRISKMIEEKVRRSSFCSVGAEYGGTIPDSSFSASSEYNSGHGPRLGRLNTPTAISTVASWCPRSVSKGEWIQVDLGKKATVVGVKIQERPTNDQRVTSFQLACGLTTSSIRTIADKNGTAKLFSGNLDRNTVITHFFKSQECRYLRIYPQTWSGRACMRMDFIESC